MNTRYQPLTPAALDWQDGVPVATTIGDVYYSRDGGLGQAQQVFLAGNALPGRWAKWAQFVILETGFGTGLNFLATWAAWQSDPLACAVLHYIAVEKHPFTRADLVRLHAQWPALQANGRALQDAWPELTPGWHRLELAAGRLRLTLLFGDAARTLPQLEARVDAFYLDGFAPRKNPDLWSPAVFAEIARLARPEATLATWCVASQVRADLAAAGFSVEKHPGFGHKKARLTGVFTGTDPDPESVLKPANSALILGAGIAGCSTAHALARRGWSITLIDQHAGPGQAASGNLAGIVRPVLSRDDNRTSRFTRAAFLYAVQNGFGATASPANPDAISHACGVFHLAQDAADAEHQQQVLRDLAFPATFVRWLDAATTSEHLGWPVEFGGWFFPRAGWMRPPQRCQALLAASGQRLTTRFNMRISEIQSTTTGWQVIDASGTVIAEAAHLILAGGAEPHALAQLHALCPDLPGLKLQRLRGQVSLLPAEDFPKPLPSVVCRDGYAIPPITGQICTGASYDFDADPNPRRSTHAHNLAKLEVLLPGSTAHIDVDALAGRVGFRAIARDRLPIIGTLAPNRWPNLHLCTGFASRGLVWSQLAGELLACQLNAEPWPIERELAAAVAPPRFYGKTRNAGNKPPTP